MASGAPGPPRPNITTVQALLVASQFGVTLAVAVGLGLFVGNWVDGQFGTRPLFILIGAFAGLAGASISSVRTYRAFLAKTGFGEKGRYKPAPPDPDEDDDQSSE